MERPDGLGFGADYNPEQWGRHVWSEDRELMLEAGVNRATVGVFAWALLEPRPGEFDFGWLDEVMDGLAGIGVEVNLGTGTANPPQWLSSRHPEILPVRRNGTSLWPGTRQAYCPSSPVFLEHALRLTRRIASRYRDHPALVTWHVNNEIGAHVARCYCDVSGAAFRKWLAVRYGQIDRLNAAWGTTVWSLRYTDWDQVLPPRQAPAFANPGHVLDFYRFSSDACHSLYLAEREVLRSIAPGTPVTTNLVAGRYGPNLDYWRWAAGLDVIATDHYPDSSDPDSHIELALAADLSRGLAHGSPWLLMEQPPSAVNWQVRNVAKLPGELTRNCLQHVARGADTAMFFQWRASLFGAEQHHSALIPHAGTDTKVWREAVALGGILRRIGAVRGTTVSAEVALILDWESWWSLDMESQPSIDVDYFDNVHRIYRALWEIGVTVDIVAPDADLSLYRLVAVPCLYIADLETGVRLGEYIAAGGGVVVSYLSGIADSNLHLYPGGHPAPFRDWLGIRIEEFFPLREGEIVALDDGSTADVWCELFHAGSAEVLAAYQDGPVAGGPALTVNRHGAGRAWYLGTRLDSSSLRTVLAGALQTVGVSHQSESGRTGVEMVRRRDETRSFLFVINHTDEPADVVAKGHELIGKRDVAGTLRVGPGRVAVIEEGRDQDAG